MNSGAEHVMKRWGFPIDADKRTDGLLVAVSLGLDALLNSSKEAEKAWMHRHHDALGETPISAICRGRIEDVIDQINRERGL